MQWPTCAYKVDFGKSSYTINYLKKYVLIEDKLQSISVKFSFDEIKLLISSLSR